MFMLFLVRDGKSSNKIVKKETVFFLSYFRQEYLPPDDISANHIDKVQENKEQEKQPHHFMKLLP